MVETQMKVISCNAAEEVELEKKNSWFIYVLVFMDTRDLWFIPGRVNIVMSRN